MVTARYAGGSYLNGVELLNGCLAVGHSGIFIPSTIHGSNLCEDSGSIDNEKLCKNLSAAIDVYINKVSVATFSGKEILLTKGDSSETAKNYQERRERLATFLKGAKYKQEALRRSYPQEFEYFEKIWSIRARHAVKSFAKNYVFMLLPCFHRDCPHPVCQGGDKATCFWYPNGPAVSFLPQPAVDQERPWGSTSCEKWLQAGQTMCCGHYLPVEKMIQLHTNGSLIRYSKPPRE